jgi:probable HAF family extracellular repeat protein
MTDVGTLGGKCSDAFGTNDAGLVAGADEFSDGASHAWVWDSENGIQDLGTFGLPESVATAVNNVGQVTGWVFSDQITRAFLWQDGAVTDLGAFQAKGLNDAAQVVGSVTVGFQTHGVLYADGVVTDLNDLVPGGSGLTIFEGRAINNGGQIAAEARDVSGAFHAVVLSPDKSPSPQPAVPGSSKVLLTRLTAPRIVEAASAPQAPVTQPQSKTETPLPIAPTVRQTVDTVFSSSRNHARASADGWGLEGWSVLYR